MSVHFSSADVHIYGLPCVFLHRVVFRDSRAESASELWLSGLNRAGVDARFTYICINVHWRARAPTSFLRLLAALLQPLAERSVFRSHEGERATVRVRWTRISLPLRMIGFGRRRGPDICPLVNE